MTTKEEDYLQTNSEGQVSACPSSPFIIHYTVLSAVLVTIHLKAFQLPLFLIGKWDMQVLISKPLVLCSSVSVENSEIWKVLQARKEGNSFHRT